MHKHTPGPWTTDGHARRFSNFGGRRCNVQARVEGTAIGRSIAHVYCSASAEKAGIDKQEVEANARLIAAAPELLAALETLAKHAQETYPHFEDTRGQHDIKVALEAIAKAKGAAGSVLR